MTVERFQVSSDVIDVTTPTRRIDTRIRFRFNPQEDNCEGWTRRDEYRRRRVQHPRNRENYEETAMTLCC